MNGHVITPEVPSNSSAPLKAVVFTSRTSTRFDTNTRQATANLRASTTPTAHHTINSEQRSKGRFVGADQSAKTQTRIGRVAESKNISMYLAEHLPRGLCFQK